MGLKNIISLHISKNSSTFGAKFSNSTMKKALYTLFFSLVACVAFVSCNETETYAEQRDRELNAIQEYIKKNNINVISESDFISNGMVTDTLKNEYVLFNSSGVYMQILSKGKGLGKMLEDGESANVLVRFVEWNINGDSLQSFNEGYSLLANSVDKMTVKNTSGTFNATFVYGIMKSRYNSTSVPTGWLVPLSYVNLVRIDSEEAELAHVKIILPHDQGHAYAQTGVYACEYEMTYERGI